MVLNIYPSSLRFSSIVIGVVFIIYALLDSLLSALILDEEYFGYLGLDIRVDQAGAILLVLASASLIFGAIERKPVFLIPFLAFIPLYLIAAWVSLMVWFYWVNLIVLAVVPILFAYAWGCIFFFWRQLK